MSNNIEKENIEFEARLRALTKEQRREVLPKLKAVLSAASRTGRISAEPSKAAPTKGGGLHE